MSKILVIQPYKMLQQAIALALAVEHKVQVTENVPQGVFPAEYDAVIIDAAALREKGVLGVEEQRAVQVWQTPTLWIDEDGSPAAPERERLVTLRWPVEKDALQKALAECLSAAGKERSEAAPAAKKAKIKETRKAKEPRAPSPVSPEPEIIELVEVVEEASVAEENRLQET